MKLKAILQSSICVSALMLPAALSAQTTSAAADTTPAADATTVPGDTIIVTGSRIRHDPLENDQPVVTLD